MNTIELIDEQRTCIQNGVVCFTPFVLILQKRVDSLCPRLALREFVNVKILKSNSPKELYVLKVIH